MPWQGIVKPPGISPAAGARAQADTVLQECRMSILKLTKIPAFLFATALCVAVPRAAQAQGGVSLSPWAGVYIPTRNSFGDLDDALSRDVSVIGGARLTFWGSGVLGFEATGGYAPARIADETLNETG